MKCDGSKYSQYHLWKRGWIVFEEETFEDSISEISATEIRKKYVTRRIQQL